MKGALMSVSDKLLRKRAIIETVNDELKNIAQVEHSRHRCFGNFVVNLLRGIAAYCYFPKKPSIRVQTVDMSNDRQLSEHHWHRLGITTHTNIITLHTNLNNN